MKKYIRHFVVAIVFHRRDDKNNVINNSLTTVSGKITSDKDIDSEFDEPLAFDQALKSDTNINLIKDGFSVFLKLCHLLPQSINPEWVEVTKKKEDQ